MGLISDLKKNNYCVTSLLGGGGGSSELTENNDLAVLLRVNESLLYMFHWIKYIKERPKKKMCSLKYVPFNLRGFYRQQQKSFRMWCPELTLNNKVK